MSSTCRGVLPAEDAWLAQRNTDFSIFSRRRDELSVPLIDVRLWPKADILSCIAHVCF